MPKREVFTPAVVVEQLSELTALLTESQQSELRKRYTLLRLPKKANVYCEGDWPEFLYCVLRGKVKIAKVGNSARTQTLRVIGAGEYFGYRAHFAGESYVATASTFEPTVVCALPLSLLERWMSENVSLCRFFVRRLARDLGIADHRTVSLTQKHVRGRLAEALLFLKGNYGLEADGATLSIFLSREDLANLSNMTTSNAIRTLSAFCAEKLVAVDGRKITLLDEPALTRLAKQG